MTELSEYEKKALAACVAWRREQTTKAPVQLLPEGIREVSTKASAAAKRIPGAGRAGQVVGKGYAAAAGGMVKVVHRATDLTLSDSRVVHAYAKRRHDVRVLEDVRELDLAAVDDVSHFKRLRNSYSLAALGEGAAAGFLITGGTAAAATGSVAGAGAGAAPGLGMVAAATGADAVATLALATHVVAHTAMYYGYDASSPEEEMFQMQVVGAGMATTTSAKTAAFADLGQLAQLLARSATWEQLSTKVFAKVTLKFANKAGQNLTQKKLGQFVPVAGVAIGAALNFRMVDEIAASAYWAYRERFLREKLDHFEATPMRADRPVRDDDVEQPILVLELLEEAKQEERDEADGIR